MGSKKGNCPIYEDKEGCVKLAVYITVQDVKRLEALFERMPEIKVKEKNKDGNN